MYIIDTSSGGIHCFENHRSTHSMTLNILVLSKKLWNIGKDCSSIREKSNWLIVVFLRPKISPSHPIIRHWYLNLSFWMFLSNSFSSLAYIISNQYVNKILILRMLGLEMIERTFINLVTHTNANARIFTRNFNNDHSIVSNTPLILYLPRCFK